MPTGLSSILILLARKSETWEVAPQRQDVLPDRGYIDLFSDRWLKTDMRALSIRQPWAELILLGHKTIEVRSKRTNLRERVFIYAGLNRIEPAEEARIAQEFGIDVNGLPRGVLVGTVKIEGCLPLKQDDSQAACFKITETHGFYAWLLARPERAENLVKPKNQPQPMFFNPF